MKSSVIIIIFAVLIPFGATAADREIKIDNIDALGKRLLEYNKMWNVYESGGMAKMGSEAFDLMTKIENALIKYFKSNPEAFEALYDKSPEVFRFEPFCCIVECNTIEEDEVLCRIIRRIIKNRNISFERVWGWSTDFAGSRAALDFLIEQRRRMPRDWPAKRKENFNEMIERMAALVEMYDEMSKLTEADVRKWKAYFLNVSDIQDILEKKYKQAEAEIKKEFYPNGFEESDAALDEEESEEKYERYENKITALYSTFPYLRRGTISRDSRAELMTAFFKFARRYREKCDLNYLPLLKLVARQGGKEDWVYGDDIGGAVILIYDETGRMRYFIQIYNLDFFSFCCPLYDVDGSVTDFLIVKVTPYLPELKTLFKEKLLPLVMKKPSPEILKKLEIGQRGPSPENEFNRKYE